MHVAMDMAPCMHGFSITIIIIIAIAMLLFKAHTAFLLSLDVQVACVSKIACCILSLHFGCLPIYFPFFHQYS